LSSQSSILVRVWSSSLVFRDDVFFHHRWFKALLARPNT
jgi:hypothetical protein